MTGTTIRSTCFAMLALALSLPTAHAADLDFAASKITVHVEKSGMFAAFAHNHVIAADRWSDALHGLRRRPGVPDRPTTAAQ